MLRHELLLVILVASITVFLISGNGNISFADNTIKCGNMKWGDKDHDDNNPSKSKFLKMAYSASLCELAKCIDHAQCSNHDSVNWKKFQQSPAYLGATEKQKDELKEAHEEGTGMDGLGGYEILYAVEDK